MKCPSCNYVSHDYLDACPSCGNDWSAFKTEIGLHVRPPGMVLNLSEVAANRAGSALPDIAMASPGTDAGTPDAMPTLEFVEIEDEPSGGTGPPDPRCPDERTTMTTGVMLTIFAAICLGASLGLAILFRFWPEYGSVEAALERSDDLVAQIESAAAHEAEGAA